MKERETHNKRKGEMFKVESTSLHKLSLAEEAAEVAGEAKDSPIVLDDDDVVPMSSNVVSEVQSFLTKLAFFTQVYID